MMPRRLRWIRNSQVFRASLDQRMVPVVLACSPVLCNKKTTNNRKLANMCKIHSELVGM
jgi:hypothetical protein